MDAIETIRANLNEIKSRFHVERIGVFGFHARHEQQPGSDVDVLVEFQPGQKTFDNFMDLQFYLEDLFGCKVDLVTTKALRPQLKDSILIEMSYV